MSRAQQGQVFDTASGQNATNEAEAQKSESAEQADIGNQQSQLAKFAADNPYVEGAQFQTSENKVIAGSADASAEAAKAAAQTQALRAGQNPAAANAAAETAAQNAQRLASTEGGEATVSRLASQAGYNQQALTDASDIAREQENLAALQSGAAQGALNTQEEAAKTPSFLDEFGNSLIQGGQDVAKMAAAGAAG